jgi:tetratricopeptide (TPR) repeat protein
MRVSVLRSVVFVACVAAAALVSRSWLKAQDNSSGSAKEPEMIEVKDAVARFKDGDIENTLKNLEKAAEKNADLPPAEVLLADFFRQANIPQGIIPWLETAVKKHPEIPDAYVTLGDVDLSSGRMTAAELVYQKAAELNAKFNGSKKRKDGLSQRIAAGLAAVAYSREDWPLAQKRLEEWLKLDPKNDRALVQLARDLFKQLKLPESLAKFKEAKEANKDSLSPEAQLALCYWEYPDKKQAEHWTGLALERSPDEASTWFFAAWIATQMKQFDKAVERADKGLKIKPNSLEGRILRGNVALFKKDYADAEKYFQEAYIGSDTSFDARNNLAIALVEQKVEAKKRRAVEIAQTNWQLHQRDQDSAEAAATLGWVLYKNDKTSDAERFLRAAASSANPNPDTLYYYAVVLKELGKPEEAKKRLEQALKSKTPFTMEPEAKFLFEKLNH